MSFHNNAAELRASIRAWKGVYSVNRIELWEELANINEGIAELIALADRNPQGEDVQQASSRSDESAGRDSDNAQNQDGASHDSWCRPCAEAVLRRDSTNASAIKVLAEFERPITPPLDSEAVERVRFLRDTLAEWASRHPNDQPHNPSGIRPFGTNDLKHHVETLDRAVALLSLANPVGSDLRQQGQEEGFAAAVRQLRDMGGQKPPPALWHAAQLLADSLEQSRIPGAALTAMKGNGDE